MNTSYDALLVVSFGGPNGPEDVVPFLETVVEGRRVPQERLQEVAEQYLLFGGVSPINEQNEALVAALRGVFQKKGPDLPIYLGNRNWHPLLEETLEKMASDQIRNAVAFFTSPYSSYSSCRQYRENIAEAQEKVGKKAPRIKKLRAYFNHPGFIEANAARLRSAFSSLPEEKQRSARLVFTAHSIPLSMAAGCQYENQLLETARLVAEKVAIPTWELAYQSRSGPSSQPWLEPDICDRIQDLGRQGVRDIVCSPVGFISDHMEVLYDLDTEAAELAERLRINFVRAATVGTHPQFVEMIRELVLERIADRPRRALGALGPSHDICPPACCRPA